MRHKKIYLILVGCGVVILLITGYSYALDNNTFGGNYAITAAGSLERIQGKSDLIKGKNILMANAIGKAHNPPVVAVVEVENEYLISLAEGFKEKEISFDSFIAEIAKSSEIQKADDMISGPFKLKISDIDIRVVDVE